MQSQDNSPKYSQGAELQIVLPVAQIVEVKEEEESEEVLQIVEGTEVDALTIQEYEIEQTMSNPPKFTKFVVEDKNFLWMPLNDDVKRRNVASFMLAYFGLVCVASMNLDFFSFLLEDNLAITGGDAADVISKVSLVCTIVILSF